MALKFISWNVNGLRACIKKGFQCFINEHNPDFLCLQEIKLSPEAEASLKDDFGYTYHHYHHAEKKGYSGTAIFCREEPLSVAYDFTPEVHHGEGRAITLEYEKFYLVNVYVPNSKGFLERLPYRTQEWDADLNNYLSILNKTKPVVFCGDLNVSYQDIDLARPSANRNSAGFTDEERMGFQNYLESGLVDTYRHLNPDKVRRYHVHYHRQSNHICLYGYPRNTA